MAPSATTTRLARASRKAVAEFDTGVVDIVRKSTGACTPYADGDQQMTTMTTSGDAVTARRVPG
jgi:hypothetical protein